MKFKIQCVAAISALMFLFGCSGEKKNESLSGEASEEHNSMIVSARDTAELRAMAIDYLTFAREGKFDQCIAMLHQYDAKTDKISDLSPENRAKILNILQSFPVINFSIDEIIFNSETNTQINYTIEMFEKDDSGVPNTMKFSLFPKRLDWEWYLCIDPINDNKQEQ